MAGGVFFRKMENCIVFIVALLFVPLSNADFVFDADAFCASAGGASGYYCHPDHTKYVKCAVSDGVFSGSVECCEPNYHFSSPVKVRLRALMSGGSFCGATSPLNHSYLPHFTP